MNRNETLKLLQAHKPYLAREFGVTALALFGSAARDVTGANSTIDILIAFDGPATSKRYFGVQFRTWTTCSWWTEYKARKDSDPHLGARARHQYVAR